MTANNSIPYYSILDMPPAEDYKEGVSALLESLGYDSIISDRDLVILRTGMFSAFGYLNLQNGYLPK